MMNSKKAHEKSRKYSQILMSNSNYLNLISIFLMTFAFGNIVKSMQTIEFILLFTILIGNDDKFRNVDHPHKTEIP